MEDVPDKNITLDMGKGDSWAKDVRTGKQGVPLDEVEKLVSVLGLKIVEATRICVTPQEMRQFQAYKVLAEAHFIAPQPTLDPGSF